MTHPAALVAHWNGSRWSVTYSPQPSYVYSALTGVVALAADDVWAVGAYRATDDVTLPLIERWDGKAWRLVAGAPLPGAQASKLDAVTRIPGTSQLWAVGYVIRAPDSTYPQGLIERWDGSAWQVVTGPTLPAGAHGSQLRDIVALSATDAWAVGSYRASDYTERALIAHWDGTSWKLAAPVDVSGLLESVAAVGPQDIRAGGVSFAHAGGSIMQALVMRWSGGVWRASAIPTPPLATASNIAAVVADRAGGFWAVGYAIQPDTHFTTALIERCA